MIYNFPKLMLMVALACTATSLLPLDRCRGDQGGTSDGQQRLGAVRIGLTVPMKNPLAGDPIPVKVTVANKSTHSIVLLTPRLNALGRDSVRFYLSKPKETKFSQVDHPAIYTGPAKSLAPPKSLPATTLAAGHSSSWTFLLAYSFLTIQRRKWLFPLPGAYRLKCDLDFIPGLQAETKKVAFGTTVTTVQSRQIQFRISSPNSNRDKNALKALRQLNNRYLLYAPDEYDSSRHEGARKEISKYFEAHPKSHFASMARLFLVMVDFKHSLAQSHVKSAKRHLTKIRDIAKGDNKMAALIAARMLPKIARRLKQAEQSVKSAKRPRHVAPASAAVTKQIKGFFDDFTVAVSTRKLSRIRSYFASTKHGSVLAKRMSDEVNDEIGSGKLEINATEISASKMAKRHYRVRLKLIAKLDGKAQRENVWTAVEVGQENDHWRIFDHLIPQQPTSNVHSTPSPDQ